MSKEMRCAICHDFGCTKVSNDKKYITLCKVCFENCEKMRNILIKQLQDNVVSYTMFDQVQQAIMEHCIE